LNQTSVLRGRRARIAFAFSVPIAVLGGLIGLGGAEFRLPVLKGPMRYSAKEAVPLNLSVSLVTLLVSLLTRAGTLPLAPLAELAPIAISLAVGAVAAAFLGTSFVRRLTERRLEMMILVLLVGIGAALIVESSFPQSGSGLLPGGSLWSIAVGVLFGSGIGLVSSMLGVAGGELIIPTLIFVFGVGVKIAGTASLLISLPTVAVGLIRYARQGAFAQRTVLGETIVPMGLGSVIGAVVGGLLVGLVSSSVLKFALGIILVVSAIRIFRSPRPGTKEWGRSVAFRYLLLLEEKSTSILTLSGHRALC
jgi:uncharacterized membrane protein YfcA